MRTAISFVCQRGDLEAKAVLLAASLRRHLVGRARLVACLPTPEAAFGSPSPDTLRALESLDVDVIPIRNPIDDGYAIGNKIACLEAPATSAAGRPGRAVFLDSDILCTARFDPDRHLTGDFCAKPADFATFGRDDEAWVRLYTMFGLPSPTRRVVATISHEEMWPYFNAGVIGARAGAGLAETWADCCRRIDAEDWVPKRRPHLDQIAMPIAAALRGLEFTTLAEELNFPAHMRPLRATPPVLCHYHAPAIAAREPLLTSEVAALVAKYPSLRPVLEANPDWEGVSLPPPRRWWSGWRWPAAKADPVSPPPAPNDVSADDLAAALARSPTPAILQSLVDISRRRFGWFTRHPSRAFEYPWVVARLARLRAGRVVDVGAGVSPVPLFLALRGLRVTTVDDSQTVRSPATGTAGWNEWGFLDYSSLMPAIESINGDAAEVQLPPGSCAAVYSISVVEHMPAETRRRLWPRLADWLAPGGQLLLTVDLVPGTDLLWNRAAGREVEPTDVHGDLAALVAELSRLGFAPAEREDLRGLPGMRADVALLAFVKAQARPEAAP